MDGTRAPLGEVELMEHCHLDEVNEKQDEVRHATICGATLANPWIMHLYSKEADNPTGWTVQGTLQNRLSKNRD